MAKVQRVIKRVNLTFPWNQESRAAFYKMADELKATPAAELGRQILGEFMLCHFGLERSKTLGIINAVAETIPKPMYLSYAQRQHTKHCDDSADTQNNQRSKVPTPK